MEIPRNPFIGDDPVDTLDMCRNVLSLLQDVDRDGSTCESRELGQVLILQGVRDALGAAGEVIQAERSNTSNLRSVGGSGK